MTKPKGLNYKLKRRSAVIKLDEVLIADEVTIRDKDHSLVTGRVQGSTSERWIEAFGARITFARRKGEEWKPTEAVQVVGHQPSMFPGQS